MDLKKLIGFLFLVLGFFLILFLPVFLFFGFVLSEFSFSFEFVFLISFIVSICFSVLFSFFISKFENEKNFIGLNFFLIFFVFILILVGWFFSGVFTFCTMNSRTNAFNQLFSFFGLFLIILFSFLGLFVFF